MIQLILIFAAMAVVASLIVLGPLFLSRKKEDAESRRRADINAEIYRQRLAELEKDLQQGELEQSEFDVLKLELDLTLLNDVPDEVETEERKKSAHRLPLVGGLFVAILAVSFAVYMLVVKNPETEKWMALQESMTQIVDRTLQRDERVMEELRKHSVADFIRVLQKRLQQDQNNDEGWFLLGSTYMQGQMMKPAKEAFQKAYNIFPENVEYGLALTRTSMAVDGGLTPQSRSVLADLYKRYPEHPGVLMSMGMASFQSEDFSGAIHYWQSLLDKMDKAPLGQEAEQSKQMLRRSIAMARQRMAGVPDKPVASSSPEERVTIPVQVTLSDELTKTLKGNEVLFVLAKAVSGPPMPLAVKKMAVGDFPVSVTLSSEDAMMANLSLSNFDEVEVIARISRKGMPSAQAGDLETRTKVSLKKGQDNPLVEMLIDQVL